MTIRKEDVVEMETQLIEGIKTSNLQFLDKILHNDLLFIAPNGQIITKEIDLASHRSGQMVVEEIVPAIEQVNIIEDTAVVVVVYDARGKMLGNPIQGTFRYIRVWKLIDGSLKVVGGSCIQL